MPAASGAPVEVPTDVLQRISALCLALPEVTVRVDEARIDGRSTAHSFDVRKRSFCLLVAVRKVSGEPSPLVVVRADLAERAALLEVGHPYFAPRAGRDRIGVRLTGDTDWEEIRDLLTDSYWRVAPKKLAARLVQPPDTHQGHDTSPPA
ncbi:MmcQ/YjbR family DNA-binding protein [Acidiferrimicrobium sp. IK]|uniref:MmcQ/YjbR family DNA-binding protein n=1 Tax=Acidiferrimicrobium sp. IK TaxID=2871700 RepID=UPI0021CB7CEC|nr:MmcQ/YjbR family DNA-binding protein [Acidiferrimicrobium sp. IK]MCU4184449.1 MmcQ/YjbR family DNA-binding protein [Acidiferrimicrobium sp. IK]